MSFQDDIQTDLNNAFFPTAADGEGFTVSATHTDLTDGTATTINLVPEEQIFSIRDSLNQVKFYVNTAELAAASVGSRVTYDSLDYTVLNVRELEGMLELSCERDDERQ